MSEPRLTDKQRRHLEMADALISSPGPGVRVRTKAVNEAIDAALAELDHLRAALAERDWLLAVVAHDEREAAEVGAARERGACAALVEAGGDGVHRLETAISLGPNAAIAAAIRARGPCLPAPPEEVIAAREREACLDIVKQFIPADPTDSRHQGALEAVRRIIRAIRERAP